jgi:type I restriction enzyme, S subunit
MVKNKLFWKKEKLGTVLTLLKDGTHNPPKRTDSGVPMLSALNINNGRINFNKDISFISKEDYEEMHKKYEITKNDILMTIVGTLGRVAIVKSQTKKFTVQRSVAIFRTDDSELLPVYLYYYIQGNDFQKNITLRSNTTAQSGIYLKELSNIEISIPPLFEQKKIADMLKSVDYAIEKTEEIIEQTEKVKKGLIQELLIKGIGHTKYKKTEIGNIPIEWELRGLKETVVKLVTGRTYTPKYVQQGIPLLRSPDLKYQYPDFSNCYYITEEEHTGFKKAVPQKDDIIYIREGGSFGIAAYVNTDREFALGQRLTLIRTNRNVLDSKFLFYQLNSNRIVNYANAIVGGNASPHINQKDFEKYKVVIPPLEEQKKIVQVLSSLDEKVEKEHRTKESLEVIKKGLMQVLLTGKLRVKLNENEVITS